MTDVVTLINLFSVTKFSRFQLLIELEQLNFVEINNKIFANIYYNCAISQKQFVGNLKNNKTFRFSVLFLLVL